MHILQSRLPLLGACSLTLALLLPAAAAVANQPVALHTPATPVVAAQRSPREWAVLACNNEVAIITHDGSFFRYRTHVIDAKGERRRDVIESKDGTVARTIEENGKPLGAEAEAAERKRLQDLANSPSDFAKHVKSDKSGKKLAADLIQLMPDAMLYAPAEDASNLRSTSGGRLIVLDFQPNSAWNPPSTTSEALTGIRGRVWIDPGTGYVVRLDAEIFRSVNIGWGMLAHVYPGGKLSFEQKNIGGNRWLFTRFADQARVRALLVKTLDVSTEITTSTYQQLPGPIGYREAIDLLLK